MDYNITMRHLGIDYGSKRIGIALSDEEASIAFPHSVIENKEGFVEQIIKIIKEKEVKKVVIGESKDFKGKDNPIMKGINKLKSELENKGIKVVYEPEFLSSHQAAQIQGENDMHDASAASIILNSFLSREK